MGVDESLETSLSRSRERESSRVRRGETAAFQNHVSIVTKILHTRPRVTRPCEQHALLALDLHVDRGLPPTTLNSDQLGQSGRERVGPRRTSGNESLVSLKAHQKHSQTRIGLETAEILKVLTNAGERATTSQRLETASDSPVSDACSARSVACGVLRREYIEFKKESYSF